MKLIKFIYWGKERHARFEYITGACPVGLLYLLDEELKEAFGYCILFNQQGSFYPCNVKGQKPAIKSLLRVLYHELYQRSLVES